MDEHLKLALSASANYSNNFVKVVQELCDRLSQEIGVKFFRIGDMNYSSSQTICLMLDEEYKPVNERCNSSFWINTFVSSKGSFYAIGCRAKDANPSRTWRIVLDRGLNQETQDYIRNINAVLEASDYILLTKPVLSQITSDHKTRLDKLPATVFRVLFSELGP